MAIEIEERLNEQLKDHEEELFDHGEDTAPEEQDDDARFAEADEFREVANKLISTIGQHKHYAEARICYLWRRWGWNKKGKPVIGTAHVLNEEQHFLTGYDLKFIVNHEMWEAATPAQREAMADHLLCMIFRADDDKDGNPVWRKADYDCIEFNAVVRRHGLWQDDLKRFMNSHAVGEIERAQGKLFEGFGEEEPQETATAGFNDAPPQDDVETSASSDLPETPSDNLRDLDPGLPAFETVTDDYEGTGLPLMECEANIDMLQLAEAAYQAQLSECVIDLIRTVPRGDGAIQTTSLYHYRGPGHEPVIMRITNAMRESWLRQLRGA